MPGIIVAIEGLDIVGKTTIAQSLSEKDGWLYYKTPPAKYYEDCVKLGIDGRPIYSEERFRLFIKCLKYSSWEISKILETGISVVVDRWLWTTLSYHFAFNVELEAKWNRIAKKEMASLVNPQLSILVQVLDEAIYTQRKMSREKLTAYDKVIVGDKWRSDFILQNFKRLNPTFVLVDNSNDFKSTMDVVWKYIASVKP